jgi:hypothetical protein
MERISIGAGVGGRTRRFQLFLEQLPLTERAQIERAERAYVVGHKARLASEEVLLAEQMIGQRDEESGRSNTNIDIVQLFGGVSY